MIENIDMIQSPELRENLQNMYNHLVKFIISYPIGEWDKKNNIYDISAIDNKLRTLVYHYVMGVGVPITISDSYIEKILISDRVESFNFDIWIGYKVFSGYRPYQDETVKLKFMIDRSLILNTLRDNKIEKICQM